MNNTLHNGLRVLEYLADTAEAVSIKEAAEYFQLPNSHICRLLKSLVEAGYVEQLPGSRKYRVSLKILSLANARLKKDRLRAFARPYLRPLAEKLDAAVFVSRIYCGHSLIVGTEYPPFFTEVHDTLIGTVHSPTCSACGLVCAAYAADEVREALLAEIDWDQPGDFQGQRPEYEAELDRVRHRGFALRDIPGVAAAVGVPLFEDHGRIAGALGVMLPPQRLLTQEIWQGALEATLSCGKLISCMQGCSPEEYPKYKQISKEEK